MLGRSLGSALLLRNRIRLGSCKQDLAFPDSSFELRDYQQEAIAEVVTQWKAGSSVQLVMLPTGTGKTVVFAALARFELLHQAEEKFGLMWPGCTVSWVKGQRKDFYGQVIVASVGTAANCIPQLTQQWKQQYVESGVEPDDALLGLQLPYADASGVSSSSSSSQAESSQAWGTAAGLSGSSGGGGGGAEGVHSRRVFTHVHLKGAGGGHGGDFITSKLSPLVNRWGAGLRWGAGFAGNAASQAPRDGLRCRRSSMLVGQEQDRDDEEDEEVEPDVLLSMAGKRAVRKAIGFAVDIEHAEALNTLFLQAGVRSAVVHSKRSVDEVKLDISRFRKGALDVLWNCEKLTEGFDEPSIDALLLARPTKSTGLYTQMLGRGLRRAPGKDNCLVLDFTDKQHKVDRIIDLRVLLPDDSYKNLGPDRQPPERKDKARKLKLEGQEGGEMSVLADEVDPYDMAFVRIGEHWSISMFDSGTLWLVKVAGMGAKQRQRLGLLPDATRLAGQAAAAAADGDAQQQADAADATAPADAASGGGGGDDDEAAYADEDRFVVLHQPVKCYDPSSWDNVAPSARHGMTEGDAYGKAVDYMQSLIRRQQAQAVRYGKARWQRYGAGKGKPVYFPKVETFSKHASWRTKVDLPAGAAATRLTRGEASNLITQGKVALATQQQLQQLQPCAEKYSYGILWPWLKPLQAGLA
ncbi:hypothetical protein COO60DRAFT_1456872 [Scenedesmus sp. NREL 46B-D3]|nr:hypothetical protein COO60DRAFT_1456872 [Scenedesmus sp. NREL 46B-D3]